MVSVVAGAATALIALGTQVLPYVPDVVTKPEMVDYIDRWSSPLLKQREDKFAELDAKIAKVADATTEQFAVVGNRLLAIDQRVLEGQIRAANQELIAYELQAQERPDNTLVRGRIGELRADINKMERELRILECELSKAKGFVTGGECR